MYRWLPESEEQNEDCNSEKPVVAELKDGCLLGIRRGGGGAG